MKLYLSPQALHLVRLPGASGPILRCSGELSVATAEALRRELALLEPMRHAVLTLNLSGCGLLDVDGILTILHAFKRLHQEGQRLVLVVGTARIARLLGVMGIDTIIPTFPTEEVAARALRGGGLPAPAPESWEAARSQTLARWRAIQAALEKPEGETHGGEPSPVTVPAYVPFPELGGALDDGEGMEPSHTPEETLHQLTSMTALCERAEELFQESPVPAGARCQFCPLYYMLGARPRDIGCRSILDPIIDAVRSGRMESARVQIGSVIRLIEELPLPEEGTRASGRDDRSAPARAGLPASRQMPAA
jgi:anti-anti-sigma factor